MTAAVLIPCGVRLRSDFNLIAPGRDKASDGWIGDTAHQQETSDHNPDETGSVPVHDADKVNEVHAVDVDDDLRQPDLTMEDVVQFLLGRCRSGEERRLRYIIFNRRIWEASNGWRQRTYTGASPHTEHAHFSFSYETALEADTRPWLEGLMDMALTAAEIDDIADRVLVKFRNSLDDLSDSERNRLTAVVDAKLAPRFAALGSAVAALGAKQTDPAALAAAVAKAVVASLPEDRDDVTVEELTESLKLILRGGVEA